MSVQTAAQLLLQKGTRIEMIKHNHLESLEQKLKDFENKVGKVWYLVDGVYSMYGDVAPIHELLKLMDKYPQLHVYVDDAHGMSWHGSHGAGYIFGQVGVPKKMMLISTLAKGFGTIGGAAVFPDDETYMKVKLFGGPLTYSHPLPPPMLGASIASANIHLSDDMPRIQSELAEKIRYCNALLADTDLVVISNPETPIYFIGVGQPRIGHSMIHKLFTAGLFVNLAHFPVVPMRRIGMRFTLTRHNRKEDIKSLVETLQDTFHQVLREENETLNSIRKAFELPPLANGSANGHALTAATPEAAILRLEKFDSISHIDKHLWNSLFDERGTYDWDGLTFLESVFKNNEKAEENWQFKYYIIYDKSGRPMAATFFTFGIYMDDFLSLPEVSKKVEHRRKSEPYFLTSRTLAMGCLFTEGQHLYLDRDNKGWKNALKLLMAELGHEEERLEAETVILRDFPKDDPEVKEFLTEYGFVTIDLPNVSIIQGITAKDEGEFLTSLTAKHRARLKHEVLPYTDQYLIEVRQEISKEEAELFYDLFINVKKNNYAVTFFDYPRKIVESMGKFPNWEFIILKVKEEADRNPNAHPIAVMFCYRGKNFYSPMLCGLNYDYLHTHHNYKQLLYQTTIRAIELRYPTVYFGYTAEVEKGKLGAVQAKRVAYIHKKDNLNMDLLSSIAATATSEN